MTDALLTNWSVFQTLCKVMANQWPQTLPTARSQLPLLVELARRENILPGLAARCETLPELARTLPPGEAGQLQQALRDNALRNMKISAQARNIALALNGAGLAPLFLKGTAQLLEPANSHIGFRHQVDIDLLVAPGQLRSASEALLADGYRFYVFAGRKMECLPDFDAAMRAGGSHHHLPPLVKPGTQVSVELHHHFLPRRFQRQNPIEAVLATASERAYHGAKFSVPSIEHQLINLILGKLVNDSYLLQHAFPLREACDFIRLMASGDNCLDLQLVQRRCGKHFECFSDLVSTLMAHQAPGGLYDPARTSRYVKVMQRRYNSLLARTLLDGRARALHLAQSLFYEPGKLQGYLGRRLGRR